MPEINPYASFIVALAGAGVGNVGLELYKARRAATRERVELSNTAAQAPLIQQSLALGNVEKAVAVQQQIILDQKAHIDFLSRQLAELRAAVDEKQEHIEQMSRDVSELRRRVERLSARKREER